MSPRIRHLLSIFMSLVLFAIAVWAIHRSLGGQSIGAIGQSFRTLPHTNILFSLLLVVMNYFGAGLVEWLAALTAGKRVTYLRMTALCFLGATFQYNAGIFGGTAVRYRIYSSTGFSSREIAVILLLILFGFTMGFLLLTGSALLSISILTALPVGSHMIGLLCLVIVAGTFLLCRRGKPVRLLHWRILLPRTQHALQLTLAASFDWILSAGILFVLLPPVVRGPFPLFVCIIMLAHSAGILSNTPGGLGVFEATILHLLPSGESAPAILAALLAYRGVRYVLPLLVASLVLGVWEIRTMRKPVPSFTHPVETISAALSEVEVKGK